MPAPLLTLAAIRKRYGSTEALRGADFSLAHGEIHALLGENGAGKSTLMKIAFGLVQPDGGRILVDGAEVTIRNPLAARRLGIGMVHQHFMDIPVFTVAENIALAAGWPPGGRGLRDRVRRLAEEAGLPLDPDALAGELSAGLRQRLEVLKALAGEARILLLDEPTSVLPPSEADTFLGLVQRLRDRGVATILITHKLQEALAVADRITVLRAGVVVRTSAAGAERADTLATAMLGSAPGRPAGRIRAAAGDVVIGVYDLVIPAATGGGTGVRSASFQIRAGEVVGLAAVEGNGQRELLRALAGLVPPTHGTIQVTGPVSFIPEDRTSEGQVGEFSLTENLVLSQGRAAPWVRRGWLDWAAARRRAGELLERFDIRAPDPDVAAKLLSGGNQQRQIIANAMERRPRVLLAENPGRGLDLRATMEVYDRLRHAAADGAAVLVHLPDLDDLLEVADRILVLAGGELIPMPEGAPRDLIGRAMLGTSVVAAAG
ncbi:MAG: ABC transporter ATP-binding protein [Gemmatimonadota bacterium]|nr:ABC transporter ATP-binding protein [Gemmatimonadota bacterium]